MVQGRYSISPAARQLGIRTNTNKGAWEEITETIGLVRGLEIDTYV